MAYGFLKTLPTSTEAGYVAVFKTADFPIQSVSSDGGTGGSGYGLQFSGIDDYVSIPQFTATGDFSISLTFTFEGNTEILIGQTFSTNDYLAVFADGSISNRIAGATPDAALAPGTLVIGQTYTVNYSRTGSTVSLDIGGTPATATNTGTHSLNAFGRYSSSLYYSGTMTGVSTWNDGTTTRTYDFNQSSGSTLPDTTSAQNGTLTNFPTDDSQWIPPSAFDNGGGNLIAYNGVDKTTRYPVDIVTFTTGVSPEVELHVRIPTAETAATIYFEADDVQTFQPLFSAQYGRDEVWQDWLFVSHDGGLTDSSGNVTPTNSGTTSATGLIGDGRDYDGINDLITATIAGSTGDLYGSAFVKFVDSGTQIIFAQDSVVGAANFRGILTASGGIQCVHRDSVGTYVNTPTSAAINDDAWHKVTITSVGPVVSAYIDGSFDSSNTAADTATYTTPFRFGQRNSATPLPFDGQMDEVRLRTPPTNVASWEAAEYANQSATSWGTSSAWEEVGAPVTNPTGTLAATESTSDTTSVSGIVVVDGSFSATESTVDTLAATGTISSAAVTGDLSATEGFQDGLSSSGVVVVKGSFSATESSLDSLSSNGTVTAYTVSGDINATESVVDGFTSLGKISVLGNFSATEGFSDTTSIDGVVLAYTVSGDASATESVQDTLSAVGTVGDAVVQGNLSVSETTTDAATFSGIIHVVGSIAVTESFSDSTFIDGKERKYEVGDVVYTISFLDSLNFSQSLRTDADDINITTTFTNAFEELNFTGDFSE